MRRNLGKKRTWLDDESQQSLISLYLGDRQNSEVAKRVANEEFGYRQVQVFLPLRLNFQLSMQRVEAMLKHPCWRQLGKSIQDETLDVMGLRWSWLDKRTTVEKSNASTVVLTGKSWDGEPTMIFHSQSAFLSELARCFNIWKVPPRSRIALCLGLGEEDCQAEVFTVDGRPLFCDHRDSERIPLTQPIDDFFQQHVWPHVPEAKPDLDTLETGYEINFRKVFYKPQALRGVDEIIEEIQAIDRETAAINAEMQPLLTSIFDSHA